MSHRKSNEFPTDSSTNTARIAQSGVGAGSGVTIVFLVGPVNEDDHTWGKISTVLGNWTGMLKVQSNRAGEIRESECASWRNSKET
jgi:hypothetical protein